MPPRKRRGMFRRNILSKEQKRRVDKLTKAYDEIERAVRSKLISETCAEALKVGLRKFWHGKRHITEIRYHDADNAVFVRLEIGRREVNLILEEREHREGAD